MIKVSDPHYFEQSAILRATQAWQSEQKTEEAISKNYQLFLEQVKRELSDLHANYAVEGLLHYPDLLRKLTPAQLFQYKNVIQSIIRQNSNIEDEELLLELQKLLSYSDLTVFDSKMNIIEAHLIPLVSQSSEMVSESLSEAYKETYYHTLYDTHKKIGYVTPFNKVNDDDLNQILFLAWAGLTYKESIKHSRHSLKKDIKQIIMQSIIRHESHAKTVKSLSILVSGGKGFKVIRMSLRSETTRIIGEATANSYEQAGFDQYQFIATLDNRTTEVCKHLDLKVFNLADRKIGVNMSPMHFYCRSTIAVYISDDDMADRQRRARDSTTNQNYKVNADLSYKEWNEKYN